MLGVSRVKFQRIIPNYPITNYHLKVYLHLLATDKYYPLVITYITRKFLNIFKFLNA